jgi:HPt (histidine-containing phosphotransfer) domain-containing protein
MERVIALLREKNQYLEKFYWVNEQELINFGVGNFDSVEDFYQVREKLLELIAMVDGLVEGENTRTPLPPVNVALRSEVQLILTSKDELVKAILAQDLQILTYIDKEKSNIIRELKSNAQAKKAVGAYATSERMKQLEQE